MLLRSFCWTTKKEVWPPRILPHIKWVIKIYFVVFSHLVKEFTKFPTPSLLFLGRITGKLHFHFLMLRKEYSKVFLYKEVICSETYIINFSWKLLHKRFWFSHKIHILSFYIRIIKFIIFILMTRPPKANLYSLSTVTVYLS